LVGIGTVFGSLITGVSRNPSLRGQFSYQILVSLLKRKININSSIIPVKSYPNFNTFKQETLLESEGKAGIYRLVNNINGKSYIGSAVDLSKRLNEHFQGNKSNIILQKALKKYGLSSSPEGFLEYCSKDKITLVGREQYDFGTTGSEV